MTVLSERFHDALTYAARLHARQKRKQTSIPCVSHLLVVERSGALTVPQTTPTDIGSLRRSRPRNSYLRQAPGPR